VHVFCFYLNGEQLVTYLMTYHRYPVLLSRSSRLLTVTSWKLARFSLRRNVSGTQMRSHVPSPSRAVRSFVPRGHTWRGALAQSYLGRFVAGRSVAESLIAPVLTQIHAHRVVLYRQPTGHHAAFSRSLVLSATNRSCFGAALQLD